MTHTHQNKNVHSLSGKVKYIIFLYVLLGFSLGLLCWAVYAHYQNSVPNTIRIKAGTREEINLNVPASGVVNTGSGKVLSLNQPVTIVAGSNINTYEMQLKLFGVVPLKNIDIEIIENKMLVPVGKPIGIYMKTQGVLVIDTGSFTDCNGQETAPSKYRLQPGDYLLSIDGKAVTGKKQIMDYVRNNNGKEIIFKVSRNDELIQVKVIPALDSDNTYKIGVWLRDSAQGIGTMTYIDSNNNFGALGHGINDADTGQLLELGSGLLYQTQIVAIKRGERGAPGELTGIIQYEPSQVSGIIVDNTAKGIYGVTDENLSSSYYDNARSIPIALKQEVKPGPAHILCSIGGVSKYYDINILSLSPGSKNINRQISLEVTDAELLELTGGIVQGMSGAPIIQNGKFVGAVTHVLVQDASKGYGIFIEDMLER